MANTKRVRFLETRIVKDGSGQKFEENVEYDLVPTSADRWIKRGLAVEVEAEAVPEAEGSREPVNESAAPAAPYEAKHAGRGNFNVIDANGVKINEAPMTKDEANDFAASLNEMASQSVSED
jgi:hypothetical protein